MPSLTDMARSMAAGSGQTSAQAGPSDLPVTDETGGADETQGKADPVDDLNQGISMIESALESLGPEAADKGRKLLEGLKEISSQEQAAAMPPLAKGSAAPSGPSVLLAPETNPTSA